MTPQLVFLALRRFVRHPTPVARVMVLVVVLVAYGTSGFLYFERPLNPELTWGQGLWYSLVTITTVGYGDLSPGSPGGRFIVALPLMFLGIGLLGYVLSLSASALVEAKAKELHGMHQVKCKDHLVLINYPGLTKLTRILAELAADDSFNQVQRDVVLIDEDLEELPPELVDLHVSYIRGNPTRDATLSRAAVDTAAYAMVLSKTGDPASDHLNVTTTLAIEARNPSITTVVECVDASTEELLRKAGSDRIVCSSRFNAHFLSQEVLTPGVQDVIDLMMSSRGDQRVQLTEFSESPATYKSLRERCQRAGHQLLGVRYLQQTRLNPPDETEVAKGTQLITIGPARLQLRV